MSSSALHSLSVVRKATIKSPSWTLDHALFHLAALESSDGIDAAVNSLHTSLQTSNNRNAILDSATNTLLALESFIFPLIFSYDVSLNSALKQYLVDGFPSTTSEFMNSTAHGVLENLKSFYVSFPPELDHKDLAEHHFTLHKAGSTLRNFSHAAPSLTSPQSPKMQRKGRSQSYAGSSKWFQNPEYQVSLAAQDVTQAETDLLNELKQTLQVYFSHLTSPSSHQHARTLLSRRLAPSISTNPLNKRSAHKLLPETESKVADVLPIKGGSLPTYGLTKILQQLEEDVKDFGPWRIVLSGRAIGDLRRINREGNTFDIVRKKLQELSEGFFSKDNHKRLAGKDVGVAVYEAKMTNDMRLVYTIDCIPDIAGRSVTQAIRMFGVYTHAQMDGRLWAAVSSWASRRGSEHRERCNTRRKRQLQDDYIVPDSWPPLEEVYDDEGPDLALDEETTLRLHAMLTSASLFHYLLRITIAHFSHEKFVPLTQAVLIGILADETFTHPFVVSSREQEIIYHPSSCFVVGRSGTGKTTTMLFKMLAIERTARKLGEKNPRQVFVTQSRVLADKVETYFRDLMQSCSRDLLFEDEHEKWVMERKKDHDELLETDDEEVAFTGLPSRFSDLEDHHFPLFLTFDKLCRLLESDIESANHQARYKGSDKVLYKPSHSSKPGASRSAERILYEDFCAAYWPRFQQTAKRFDPALVWNEFQGVIRGSEQSLTGSKGYIDRETYESLSFRKQAAFANHRTQIYDIFESYMRQKKMRGQYDASDRTHALLRHLENKLPTTLFDYIYVDEVQDNLLIDIKLLRQLCPNPHGFFWAGDTAQQITSTAFRFSDLKAFLYRIEEANAASSRRYTAIHPEHFTLSINYRSHRGIVNCAHSVIELLTYMWPDSIDVLERESGQNDGPKPAFLSGIADVTTLFRPKDGHQDRLQFGANQCILVRNKSARQELRKRINDIALILTLYESKGLEFNDVLLYNFFEDSVVQSDWRVVLNAVVGKTRSEIHVPAFDELRHLGVCSELKFLYVGLTRARNRLWIVDNSLSAEPMKLLWNELGLVELKGSEYSIAQWEVNSTAEEWKEKGHLFSRRGNYEHAVYCYNNADEPLLSRIAKSRHLEKMAELIEEGTNPRRQAFIVAADEFRACADDVTYQQSDKQRKVCGFRAAKCYARAGEDRRASDVFYKSGYFTFAAQHARKAKAYDRALEIVQTCPVDDEVTKTIKSVCQVVFLREKSFSKARRLAASDEELLNRCEIFGFDKTPVLKESGHYEEAGDVQAQRQDHIYAADFYLQSKSTSAMQKASASLRQAWWYILPFGVNSHSCDTATLQKVKGMTEQLDRTPDWSDELQMFESILQDDNISLHRLSERFVKTGNFVAGLRCLFHAFRNQQDIQSIKMEQMHGFARFVRESLLNQAAFDLATSENSQKLLGYRLSKDRTEVTLFRASVLSDHLSKTSEIPRRYKVVSSSGNEEFVISTQDAGHIIWNILSQELQRIIERYCDAAKTARIFQQLCVNHLVGNCQTDNCWRPHIAPDATKEAVNKRFRVFLHHFLVINDLPMRSVRRVRRPWISRFFDILYPQISAVGRLVDIVHYPDRIIQQGLFILRDWIRDEIYSLHAFSRISTLNPHNIEALQELLLIATGIVPLTIKEEVTKINEAVDHYRVPRYIIRAPVVRHDDLRPPFLLDIINGLFAHALGAMESGVSYLCHVLQERIVVDVHSLILILEIVTAVLVVGLKPDLHGLVIPRSWLFTLAQRRAWPSYKVLAFIGHLINPLMILVSEIQAGSEHLRLAGKSLREARHKDCSILIERIFRCLITVGCNTDSEVVRNTLIGSRISSLSGDTETFARIERYVTASDWNELLSFMIQTRAFSKDDFVIQIVVKDNAKPLESLPGVKPEAIPNVGSLYFLFPRSPFLRVAQESKLRKDAKEFIPQRQLPTPKQNPMQPISDTVASSAIDDLPPTAVIDETQLRMVADVKEKAAALKILTLYRRYRRRLEFISRPDRLQHWYKEYNLVSKTLTCSRRYKMLIKGPIPHFMICLEALKKHLSKETLRMSAYLQSEDHQPLEDTMGQLANIDASKKRIDSAITRLEPNSPVHFIGFIVTLEEEIKSIYPLLKGLCQDRPGLEEHLNLAHRVITHTPSAKPATRPVRPVLNTSDLFELDF